MRTDLKERHDQTLTELTKHYTGQGYKVEREPAVRIQIGDHSYQPDLIATRGEETLVVEVRVASGSRDEQEQRWARIAEAVNSRPGWRFVLVLGGRTGTNEAEPSSEQIVRQRISEASSLISTGPNAAALLAWAALEAAARLALMKQGRPLARSNSGALVSALALDGLVSPEEEDELQRLASVRNRIAHGEFSASIVPEACRQLLQIAERLIGSKHGEDR